MSKRRVYEPVRDRGWSNGRYWKEKQGEPETEEYYRAFCPDCKKETLHEWDLCTVCDIVDQRSHGVTKLVQPEAAHVFVGNIAD